MPSLLLMFFVLISFVSLSQFQAKLGNSSQQDGFEGRVSMKRCQIGYFSLDQHRQNQDNYKQVKHRFFQRIWNFVDLWFFLFQTKRFSWSLALQKSSVKVIVFCMHGLDIGYHYYEWLRGHHSPNFCHCAIMMIEIFGIGTDAWLSRRRVKASRFMTMQRTSTTVSTWWWSKLIIEAFVREKCTYNKTSKRLIISHSTSGNFMDQVYLFQKSAILMMNEPSHFPGTTSKRFPMQ